MAGILPAVAAGLSTSVATAGLLVSAFSLTCAVTAPLLPLLLGRVPRRVLLTLALLGFTVTNVLAALAPTLGVLMRRLRWPRPTRLHRPAGQRRGRRATGRGRRCVRSRTLGGPSLAATRGAAGRAVDLSRGPTGGPQPAPGPLEGASAAAAAAVGPREATDKGPWRTGQGPLGTACGDLGQGV